MTRRVAAVLAFAALTVTAASARADAYQYHRTCRNGTPASQEESESRHELVLQDAIPYEKITFLAMRRPCTAGREQFVITSTVDRSDGTLLRASMSNELSLRLRVKCTAALEGCAAQRNEAHALLLPGRQLGR